MASDLSDWSALPKSLFVVGAKSVDGVVFDVQTCSVPMALAPEVEYVRAAELTRLRAEVAEAQREREGFREECQRRRFDLLDAERDRDAAKAEAERLREALATARGLYQVTHIHAAIDVALQEKPHE